GKDAADESEAGVRQPVASARVVEDVLLAVRGPQAEVDVGAVAGLIRERLGSERGEQAVAGGDAARRLPERDLVVGAAERFGEAHGKLLLAGAELRAILLGKHALGDERLDHLG